MTPPFSRWISVPPLLLRCAALAGLFEGLAIVRYQVLQGDLDRMPLALAWSGLFVLVHLVVWLGLGILARSRFETAGTVRSALLVWATVVIVGRSMLRDRLVPGIWLPAIGGLLLVSLLPGRLWRSQTRWPRELASYVGVFLVGTTSLLGLVPDDSTSPQATLAFLATTALLALALLVAAERWPKSLVALLLVAALAGPAVGRLRTRPTGPNVLFVLLDTTRRDHVPPFGDRVLDQTVAELAAGGVRFDEAVTVVPKTPESVASFWTGLYPYRHGVRGLYDRLDTDQPTLAELFRNSGYDTTALIDNGWLTRGRGFGRGFRTFRGFYELATPYGAWTEFSWWRFVDQLTLHRIPHFSPQVSARRLTDAGIAALERDRNRPFFLYAHYFEPHWPYFPPPDKALRYGGPPDGRTLVNYVQALGIPRGILIFQNPLPEVENEKARRLYRGEVDDTLSEVRRLLAALARLDLERDTIVVFTADHGHSLGEHDYYFHHGEFLYDDSVRIPLVLRWPGHLPAGRVVTSQVRSIDVAPTLLQLAGVPGPGNTDGRSLERLWREDSDPDLLAFIESDVRMFKENLRRDLFGIVGKMRAIRTSDRKLILNPRLDGFHFELFDLDSDPRELADLSGDAEHRAEFLELRNRLWSMIPAAERKQLLASLESAAQSEDEESGTRTDLEQLRSLGYIN